MQIVIDARYVSDHFPGIGRYTYNLLRALAELEQPHHFTAIYNPALRNTRHAMAVLEQPARMRLAVTQARPFSLAEQLQIPRLLRQLGADLYHAPYYIRPYAGLPCPVVVTLHDAIPRLFPEESSWRARLLFDLLNRLAIRSARRIFTVSESARADLAAAYHMPTGRLLVIPHAAEARFCPQPAETIAAARARYGLPERYVLSFSSNKPHKNLPCLVEAFALLVRTGRLPSGSVGLVIGGHWDLRYPQAHDLAARLGLADHVRFLPDVAEADLPALYSGAELFAFPSLYEGFGLPPLEAMACGTPVLCGAVASLPEVVGDAALQVDVRSAEALAAGLAMLLNDAALRLRLREAGLRRAAGFSWQRSAEVTMAGYLQAIQRNEQ